MKQRYHLQVIAIGLLYLLGSVTAGQDAPQIESDGTAQIQAAIQSYAAAFQARDVKKLASLWSADGVYTSRSDGEQVRGREALTKQLEELFAGDVDPNLVLETEAIEFISPSVALERGTATVTRGDAEPTQTSYSTVFVKHDGQWLIDRVTEDEIVVEYSNHDRLAGLEWMIGEWVDEGEDFAVELNCQWTTNQNYISRTYKVTTTEGVETSGLQLIGWDPAKKQIRSWLFDSSGEFIAGTWTQSDSKWVVQSVASLADGGSGSFTSVFRPLEDGTYAWKKINRVVDGRILPNIDEIIIRRQ